ncbi:MCE family protein [bacterium]|nr:MCE family protein [bacterium]
MQITGAQKRRVALFFIGGASFFLLLIALLVGNRLLKREDCYVSIFEDLSVAGLSEGSSVKFQGMNIGTVRDIQVDPNDTSKVHLHFCLKPGVPIKEGTTAQLESIGITGMKFLELKGGGKGKDIPVGGTIPSTRSAWDDISGKAGTIAVKLEEILNKVNLALGEVKPGTFGKLATNITGITESLDIILKENRTGVSSAISKINGIMGQLKKDLEIYGELGENVVKMTGEGGSVTQTLDNTAQLTSDFKNTYENAKIDENMVKLFKAVDSLQSAMDGVNKIMLKNQGNINASLSDLSDSLYNLSEFSRIIMENPASLFQGNKGETK